MYTRLLELDGGEGRQGIGGGRPGRGRVDFVVSCYRCLLSLMLSPSVLFSPGKQGSVMEWLPFYFGKNRHRLGLMNVCSLHAHLIGEMLFNGNSFVCSEEGSEFCSLCAKQRLLFSS